MHRTNVNTRDTECQDNKNVILSRYIRKVKGTHRNLVASGDGGGGGDRNPP